MRLLITPYPPDGVDILQRRLFRDEYVCFFDVGVRAAPKDSPTISPRAHITDRLSQQRAPDLRLEMERQGVQRRFAVSVASFSGVAAFLRGSDMLATLPRLLGAGLMREFRPRRRARAIRAPGTSQCRCLAPPPRRAIRP